MSSPASWATSRPRRSRYPDTTEPEAADEGPDEPRHETSVSACLIARRHVIHDLLRLLVSSVDLPIATVAVGATDDTVDLVVRHGLDVERAVAGQGLWPVGVLADELYVVTDTARHESARDHPLVTGPPGVRFFAAVPVRDGDGSPVATLNVAGLRPHRPDERLLDALSTTARLVAQQLTVVVAAAGTSRDHRHVTADFTQAERLLAAEGRLLEGIVASEPLDTVLAVAVDALEVLGDGHWLIVLDATVADRLRLDRRIGRAETPDRTTLVSTFEVRDTGRRVVATIERHAEESGAATAERLAPLDPVEFDRLVRLVAVAIGHHRADAELWEASTLLRAASQLGNLGGWSVDVPPTRVTWSDEVSALHGEPPGFSPTVDAAIGYYAPEHVPRITEAFTNCVELGEPYDVQAEIVRADGSRFWCRTIGEAHREASGRIVRVVGAFQDISAFKESESALVESEERFRLLSEATSDVVFDWDVDSNTIWYGDGLEAWVGPLNNPVLTMEGVIRRIHADDTERIASSLRTVLMSGEDFWSERFRLLRGDGTPLPVEVTAFVIRDDQGRSHRLVGSLVDMTAQDDLERRLAQSQRLESVGQLTGGVAHDFNNLLTVILGNADLLVEDLRGDVEHRAMAEMIRSAAERGAELTRQLLAFARRQPLAPRVVDVAQLIAGFEGLLRRTLSEDVDLRVETDTPVWPAWVDVSQLDSALLNVCLNARDAMPGGGRLTISVGSERLGAGDLGPGAEIDDDLVPGAYVVLTITDTGHGMSTEILDRAFEPFYTTKAPGQGSGLGLSMVYGFAKQSRGYVRITSTPDDGTTVRLYLPAAVGEHVESPAESVSHPIGGTERILLVEDDDLVRDVAAAQLRSLGYSVIEAVDGDAALEALRHDLLGAGTPGHQPIALLFTDIVMPGGLDGRELSDAARSLAPDLPVLFASGYPQDTIVHQGRLEPGVELLSKPYRLDDVARRVRQVLDGSR